MRDLTIGDLLDATKHIEELQQIAEDQNRQLHELLKIIDEYREFIIEQMKITRDYVPAQEDKDHYDYMINELSGIKVQ